MSPLTATLPEHLLDKGPYSYVSPAPQRCLSELQDNGPQLQASTSVEFGKPFRSHPELGVDIIAYCIVYARPASIFGRPSTGRTLRVVAGRSVHNVREMKTLQCGVFCRTAACITGIIYSVRHVQSPLLIVPTGYIMRSSCFQFVPMRQGIRFLAEQPSGMGLSPK